MDITVLCGGVGAARLLCGFNSLVKTHPDLTIKAIVNTGDDEQIYRFHVSPDIDSILYHLSDLHDNERGWGRKEDTFNFVETLRSLGIDAWFNLGDKDMSLNHLRTQMLQDGSNLSEATAHLAKTLGIGSIEIIPMTNDDAKTRITTKELGELSLQEYFVREKCQPTINSIMYGSTKAQLNTIAEDALITTDKIIIAPSNPYLSIFPITQLPGVEDLLSSLKHKVVAVSPIVSGQAIKGPLAKIMKNYSLEVTPFSIAYLYKDFISQLFIDNEDEEFSNAIHGLGIKPIIFDTMMTDQTKRVDLAKAIIES